MDKLKLSLNGVNEGTSQNLWCLDTSRTNRICGDEYACSDFDHSFQNDVRLEGNSTVFSVEIIC